MSVLLEFCESGSGRVFHTDTVPSLEDGKRLILQRDAEWDRMTDEQRSAPSGPFSSWEGCDVYATVTESDGTQHHYLFDDDWCPE